MWIKRMNKGIAAVAIMAAFLYCAPLQARLTLAPDAQGYQLIDSAERYGPVYKFIDISGTGERLVLTDDGSAEIRFGFGFEFYGKTYYTASVSANGYISFGNSGNGYNPAGLAIPQLASTPGWQTSPFIAPWFDDLNPSAGGAVYFEVQGKSPNRQVVVQWRVAHHDGQATKLVEFEAVLYQGTNRILFQYNQTNVGDSALSHGASATAGIQGSDSVGINYSASQPLLTDRLAIGMAPIKYGYIGIPAGPQQQSGSYGQVVSYQVEVVNGKDVATDFTIEVLPGSRWQVVAPTTTGMIGPKLSKIITVNVTVPATSSSTIGDDIVGLRIYEKVAPVVTTGTSGESSGSSNTQNNEENVAVPIKVDIELTSLVTLKTSCTPAPCFEQDSDGDGIADSREAVSSAANASKIDGLAVLSGALMDIEVTGGALYGFKVEEALNGPENVAFAAGLFNYRVIPNRVADSVVVTITPATPWSDRLVLYKVDSEGKYTKIAAEKWARVENSNAIKLTLVDGGEFDEDGVANGVIVDSLAIGLTVDPVPASDSFGSGGALFEELLLLVLLAGARYRAWRSRRCPS